MKANISFRKSFLITACAALSLFVACTPDEVKNGNPLTEGDLDAGFTLVSVTDTLIQVGTIMHNAQNYVFEANSTEERIQYHTWNTSDITGAYNADNSVKNGTTYKFTFTESGTYNVEHRVVGRVGGTNFRTEQSFTVTLPEEPETVEGPNLVTSPNFETPSDWTVLNITPGATWTFGNGTATISGTTGHQAIYQAINVEAGKTYEFDMNVAGPGSTNTWFEVYVSPTAPVANTDYSAGGKRMQLNTWAGCATSAFDGPLTEEQCGTNDVAGNTMTFSTDQTVYFLIKCGSGDGNINSISVSDVTFHTIE